MIAEPMKAPESRGAHEGSASIAETLFAALARSTDGLRRMELHAAGGRHWKAAEIDAGLAELEAAGRIECSRVVTRGRPAEKWRLTSRNGFAELPAQKDRNSGRITEATAPNDIRVGWERWRDAQIRRLGLEGVR